MQKSHKRELMYQNLCPDHLRIFFIAKLSTKRVQENYTDVAQAAGSIRKDKWDFFVYYISGIRYAPTCEARYVYQGNVGLLISILLIQ